MLILFTIRLIILLFFKVVSTKPITNVTLNNKSKIIIATIVINILILVIFSIVNKIKKLNLILFYDS